MNLNGICLPANFFFAAHECMKEPCRSYVTAPSEGNTENGTTFKNSPLVKNLNTNGIHTNHRS